MKLNAKKIMKRPIMIIGKAQKVFLSVKFLQFWAVYKSRDLKIKKRNEGLQLRLMEGESLNLPKLDFL